MTNPYWDPLHVEPYLYIAIGVILGGVIAWFSSHGPTPPDTNAGLIDELGSQIVSR